MDGTAKEEEQDGMSVHSPCKAPPSSTSSLSKASLNEQSQVDLELRILEALEIYPLVKLQGIHRHFILYSLMEFMRRRFDLALCCFLLCIVFHVLSKDSSMALTQIVY
ncbi:hypothetical protein PVL29_000046 [Vitis rotundifolia]|uniref:Uncharacterized protein n=1 Tax=Vitis rotundifolia TaxID=103349 RepID=A0AA39AJX1_VITRO|nr:hypothetical protein PVL29_000046 [Vitis rotundifolia]